MSLLLSACGCDEYDVAQAGDVLHSPKLIIEVLSEKRSDELDATLKEYQARPSIEEYIVIDSRRRWLQRCSRPDGRRDFAIDPIRVSGSLVLSSIDHLLDIDELYCLVRFRGVSR